MYHMTYVCIAETKTGCAQEIILACRLLCTLLDVHKEKFMISIPVYVLVTDDSLWVLWKDINGKMDIFQVRNSPRGSLCGHIRVITHRRLKGRAAVTSKDCFFCIE